MKQGIGFLLCASLILAGCGKKSDDSSDGGARVEPKSVIGESTKIGVFPDGTVAQPLTDQQMQAISQSTKGALMINEAVTSMTPTSLQRIGDAKVEAAQALLGSSMLKSVMKLREANPDLDQFKQELKTTCTAEQSNNQPIESGDDNNKQISLVTWNSLHGSNCPVDSRMDLDVKLSGQRLSDRAIRLAGVVLLTSRTSLIQADDQMQFDFMNQTASGRLTGEAVIQERNIEIAANGDLGGKLQTKTQGMMEAKVLFDLYAVGQNQTENGQDSTQLSQSRMTVAVVLNTPSGNLLLQVFGASNGQQTTTKAYLNGKELPQNSLN